MPPISLLHPWLLAGLATATLPVIIHLIGRKRAPTVHFAAFDFLMAVNKRLARRERLRQFLLLLLRTLAIIALVLAATRPMRDLPASAAGAMRQWVLIIDASGSMAYELDGENLLERAKRAALDITSHLQPGDALSLVIAGEELRTPFQTPTIDHAAVRAAIGEIALPGAERAGTGAGGATAVADMGGAIDLGISQFQNHAGTSEATTGLIIVSDLSKNSFEQLRPTSLDPPPEVRLVDAAARERSTPLSNTAVESVRILHSGDSSTERRFEVTVHNYSGAPVQQRGLALVVEGAVVARGYVDVGARGSTEKILTHNFEGPGIYRGEIRLAADSLDGYAQDDAAAFVSEVAAGVRVLAINGDPRTTPYEDELFFLERALEAIPKGDPPIALSSVTVDELLDIDLKAFDVVVASNVGELPAEDIDRLQAFVNDGGGLLFTLGALMRFELVNELFGDLLPVALRDLHRAADTNAGTPPVGLAELDWQHPIIGGLGAALEQGLRASRTAQYFNLGVGSGLKSRPLIRFDNGAPALVERRMGQGRVMMLTTSIDVDLTDLPLRSAFPPLLQRTVRYLAGAVETPRTTEIKAGGTVEISAPTGARGIALIAPSGARRVYALGDTDRRARFDEVTEPGMYQVEVQREKGWQASPKLAIAVNTALTESDFMPVGAERVSDALGGTDGASAVSVVVGGKEGSDPFATRGYASFLLMALCLLFVGESLLASKG